MTATARRDEIQRHIVGTTVPAAIEAERALLGILLNDRDTLDVIEGLRSVDLYDPLHGRILGAISDRHATGSLADASILDGLFAQDEAYRQRGGMLWLQSLAEIAPGSSRAPAYAAEIRETAQRRELLKLADRMAEDVREGETTAADVIGSVEASLLAMQASTRSLELVPAGLAAARVLARLDAPEEAARGITTGLPPLDDEIGPLLPGNLILGFARPSMGKSATSENIAYNVAEQGYGAIQINVEMSEEEMAERHLSDICHHLYGSRGPKYQDIRRRRIEPGERRMLGVAQETLDRLPLRMIKRSGIKVSQLRSLCRRQAAEWARKGIKLGLVVVDHAGRVNPDERVKDRYTAQAIVSASMKELSGELDCALMALLQMSRANESREEKRPQLSDIRDAGQWEEDADIAIGFYREAYYAQRQPEPKKDLDIAEWHRARNSPTVEALILKNRAGACSTVKLWGDVARNAIRGAAPEGSLFDD